MFKLKGVIPPMITPFDREGEVDIPALERLVGFLAQHVHGLFICGSYGSGPMMSVDERKQVAETTMKIAAGRVAVVVHTGTTNTRETVELSRHARQIGCQAVSAVGPYYFTHSESDLLYFYSDILESVGADFPVYVYNNPRFQGYEISLGTMKRLKAIGVHGVKDATFNVQTLAAYQRELADDNFDVVLGTEAMWLPARVLGCQAFIPGLGNAFPELCGKMWQEGMDGDYQACRATQFLVNEIREYMYLARSTQLAVYAMVALRGIVSAYPRAPFIPATEEEFAALQAALEKIGVLHVPVND
jgi:dihydrodipicolinate synthase/N-acetylneuraminate lyase